jgi:hypothetical protein
MVEKRLKLNHTKLVNCIDDVRCAGFGMNGCTGQSTDNMEAAREIARGKKMFVTEHTKLTDFQVGFWPVYEVTKAMGAINDRPIL